MMFESLLVVCTANICRSPIAERLLRQALPCKKIDSAGVRAMAGQEADVLAVRVANQYGISLAGHKSTQFTPALARQYDLILAMELLHIKEIRRIAAETLGKTKLLGEWIGKKEIPDFYQQSKEVSELVYKLINQACQGWVNKLSR